MVDANKPTGFTNQDYWIFKQKLLEIYYFFIRRILKNIDVEWDQTYMVASKKRLKKKLIF